MTGVHTGSSGSGVREGSSGTGVAALLDIDELPAKWDTAVWGTSKWAPTETEDLES